MLVFCGLQPRRKAGSGLPAGRPSCILLAIHLVFLFLLPLYNLLVIPAHIIHASDDGIESAWKGSWKRIFSRVYRLVAKIAVYWKRQQKKVFLFLFYKSTSPKLLTFLLHDQLSLRGPDINLNTSPRQLSTTFIEWPCIYCYLYSMYLTICYTPFNGNGRQFLGALDVEPICDIFLNL